MPLPCQLNLVVRDLDATLVFYRLLGWSVGEPTGLHATAELGGGLMVDFDQQEFARDWNRGAPAEVAGGSSVLCTAVSERADVDAVWTRLTSAGYPSRQIPYDTFWGSRFAVVADPDGYQIGIMSPSSEEHRSWPPTPAPE